MRSLPDHSRSSKRYGRTRGENGYDCSTSRSHDRHAPSANDASLSDRSSDDRFTPDAAVAIEEGGNADRGLVTDSHRKSHRNRFLFARLAWRRSHLFASCIRERDDVRAGWDGDAELRRHADIAPVERDV